MSDVQAQARALGDPTRHAIFRDILGAEVPVGIAELTEHFALNHNAIRQHVAKLVDAGLVLESTAASTGRGRPRLVYVVAPAIAGQWGTAGPYERLSRLLLEIIRTGRAAEDVGRRSAGELARSAPSGDAITDLTTAMARQGFDPEVRTSAGRTEIVLHRCPFESAAIADRDTVCALHLGIAQGVAEGTSVVVDELVARDPRTAGCLLRVETSDAPPSTGGGRLSLQGRRARRITKEARRTNHDHAR